MGQGRRTGQGPKLEPILGIGAFPGYGPTLRTGALPLTATSPSTTAAPQSGRKHTPPPELPIPVSLQARAKVQCGVPRPQDDREAS